jgi:hypothetical protein
MFAYHIKKKGFIGDSILPLNQLDKISPEIASIAREKYVGRKHDHTSKVVYDPQTSINLNLGMEKLYWGDVAFFTLHNPQTVLNEFDKLELPRKKGFKFFKIPLDRFSERAFVWLYEKEVYEQNLDPKECITLAQAEYKVDITKVSPLTIKYLNYCKENQILPLLYANVPHLLSPDPVNIKGVEIIETY